MEGRWGLTLPLSGVPLAEHGEFVKRAEAAGYTDLWTGETAGPDGFTPLALSAAWTERMRLGTGIVGVFQRGPALLAQEAAALADASGGRFVLGIGSSSDRIIEGWNGIPFEKPLSKPKFEAAAVSLLRYIEENADGFRILVRDSNPGSGGGTYGTLLADIAGQVEYIMADFLKSRGRDPKLAPMYSRMMVGMVAFTGQWWLDARKPKLEQVAANLIDLAWNGLSQLDAQA